MYWGYFITIFLLGNCIQGQWLPAEPQWQHWFQDLSLGNVSRLWKTTHFYHNFILQIKSVQFLTQKIFLIEPYRTTVIFWNTFINSLSDLKFHTKSSHILAFCGSSQQIPIPKGGKAHFLVFRPMLILSLSTADYTLQLTQHSTTKPYLIMKAHTTCNALVYTSWQEGYGWKKKEKVIQENETRLQIITLTTHCQDCRIMHKRRKIDN